MTSTDVMLREEQAVHGLELAERIFTPARREAIAQFLNIAPEDAALTPYLATCASYGLDPVMGQIWLIPQRVKVRDGDATHFADRYRPSVGRDGFLAIARRDSRYGGLLGSAVCEFDTFEVAYEGNEATDPKVIHRFASKPVAFEANVNPARWRGRVVGAWAKALIKGQPAQFFYAPIQEYVRMREKWEGSGASRHKVLDAAGNAVLEPDGAWGYVSSMALKAAQSYVLRIGFGITGIVPADEIAGQGAAVDASAVDEAFGPEPFDFTTLTDDPELAARLAEAVERVEALAPLSWPAAKIEMVAAGMSDEKLRGLAERIEREAELLAERAHGGAVGASGVSAGDPSGAEEPSAEGVTDAQVVDESDTGSDTGAVDRDEATGQPAAEARGELADRVERVAALERRLTGLTEQLQEPGLSDEDQAMLAEEYDKVEAELAAARCDNQGSLL